MVNWTQLDTKLGTPNTQRDILVRHNGSNTMQYNPVWNDESSISCLETKQKMVHGFSWPTTADWYSMRLDDSHEVQKYNTSKIEHWIPSALSSSSVVSMKSLPNISSKNKFLMRTGKYMVQNNTISSNTNKFFFLQILSLIWSDRKKKPLVGCLTIMAWPRNCQLKSNLCWWMRS